jgi:hypothetical protein
VARGDGADQRCFRNTRRAGTAVARYAPCGGVGAGDAADRGLSGQPLYGDASAETGAAGIAPVLRWGGASSARAPDLVAAVVYAAALRAAVNSLAAVIRFNGASSVSGSLPLANAAIASSVLAARKGVPPFDIPFWS